MPVPPVVLELDGVVKHYAWGSPEAIPNLLGRKQDQGQPVAELWFGAHPQDPSPVPARGETLDTLISADPVRVLGATTAARFGDRLPFLLKVIAPRKALSIQVHPNLEQAWKGFAAEDERGVARDAPERNYRDANHKPELLCALTRFDALCGFRPVLDTITLLDELAVAELREVRDLLAGKGGVRAAVTHLLTLENPEPLVSAVTQACRRLDDGARWAGVAGAVVLAEADFPGDIGVILALMLNHVQLEAGQAVYLAAGTMHCYLRGMAVEVMANSDNVLRCGLTPKHVDIPELLRITDFSPLAEPRCHGREFGGVRTFYPPIPDFRLSMMDLPGDTSAIPADAGPRIVLCTDGAIDMGSGVSLSPGQGAFVAAGSGDLELRGGGRVFVAAVGC